jgi:DNA-3-methyladenine glycosylase II
MTTQSGKHTILNVGRRVARRRQTFDGRTIETMADVQEGIAALRATCRYARMMHDRAGDPPLRRNPAGFAGLARIVVGQQVSVASASAIWARCETVIAPMTATTVRGLTEAELRSAGLSGPKIRTLCALADAATAGLDIDALAGAPEDEVRARLTAVSGIGPWTADIYLMFCLGRADVFAPGDLAIQIAAQHVMGLAERPSAQDLAAIAQKRWRPWRAVAGRLLWAYYAAVKAPTSGAPV